MTILTFPSGLRNPSSVSGPALQANTQTGGRSPFDGTEQTLELPGARWVAELRWNNLPVDQWRLLSAFLTSLRGQAGRFTWGPSGFWPRRGTGVAVDAVTDVPRVNGAGQTGSILNTTGWAGSGYCFEAGDFVGFLSTAGRPQLHMVRERVGRAGADANFFIDPPIRRSPNDAEPLILAAPLAVWKMVDDRVAPDFTQNGGPKASFTVAIEEAIWG